MIRPTITQYGKGEWIAIVTQFNREFVDDLKDAVSPEWRQWGGKQDGWIIAPAGIASAIQVARKHFPDILDTREMSGQDVDDAQLEAEIAEIKANQAYLLGSEDWIWEAIAALDSAMSDYSPRSHSRVKSRMARDAALLRHSLENARLPLEALTELHVRGLAAACRLARENTITDLVRK